MIDKTDVLARGLAECSIPQERIESLAQKMESYISEITLFNSAYNLTNTSEHDALVTRHILDSLAAYKEIREYADCFGPSCVIADIGSGGGLPGIPLAAAFLDDSGVRFELVERMEKRCAFLENCAAILGLGNVVVRKTDAEKIPRKSYDLVTFRAFRPLDENMARILLGIVRDGGILCAYKARPENIRAEMSAIKNLVPEYEVVPLAVPGLEDSQRNLVVIKKQ